MFACLGLLAFLMKSPAVLAPAAPPAGARELITDASIVRRIPAGQLANPPSVRVTGTVTHANPLLRDFFIQDDSSGLYVMTLDPWPNVKRGDRVTVTGQAVAGDFAPCIDPVHVTVVGTAELPPGLPYDLGEAESRWLDAQTVTVIADVLDVSVQDRHCELAIHSTQSRGSITIPGAQHAPSLMALRGRTVKVTGVCVPRYDKRRAIVGPPRILVSSPDQIVPLPVKAKYAADKQLKISELMQFFPTPFPGSRRVRTEGIVVGLWKGQILVQDGSHGVTIVPREKSPKVPVGHRIQTSGLLHVTDEVCQIEDATLLDLGPVAIPVAQTATEEELVRGSCHARRIRLAGTVVAIEPTRYGTPALLVEVGISRAVVLDPFGNTPVAIGSTVEATGLAIKQGPWAKADCGLRLDASSSLVVTGPPPESRSGGLIPPRRGLILAGVLSLAALFGMIVHGMSKARQKDLVKVKAHQDSEYADKLRQSQKMEAIGRLAGGIAHDFNNMLTVINGSAEILPEIVEVDPEGARALASDIRMAGTKAAGLVAQLLTFSRQRPTQLAPVDLNTVVADCEKMLRRVIGEDVKIFTIKDDGMPSVLGEPILLHQVIVNLVVNARDAMPKGGTVTIATRKIIGNDGTAVVRLTVTDTGCGMTPEVREKLFEPFFTTKGVGQGTGLGLATVYGIVQTLGGSIRVDSEVGVGTTFDIDFPVAPPSIPTASTDTSKRISRILRANSARRIMLVEDDDAVRELTTRILERVGFNVAIADTPEIALELLAETRYDLLITDVVMPGMGGRELADRAREHDPGLRVLFISGYTSDEVLRRGVQEDDVDFLNKPFASNQLSDKVQDILNRKVGKRSSQFLKQPVLNA